MGKHKKTTPSQSQGDLRSIVNECVDNIFDYCEFDIHDHNIELEVATQVSRYLDMCLDKRVDFGAFERKHITPLKKEIVLLNAKTQSNQEDIDKNTQDVEDLNYLIETLIDLKKLHLSHSANNKIFSKCKRKFESLKNKIDEGFYASYNTTNSSTGDSKEQVRRTRFKFKGGAKLLDKDL